MGLPTKVLDADTLRVTIPVTRADILHFCDIAEDCAVAYGFNNINKTVPKTACIANQVRLQRKSLIDHTPTALLVRTQSRLGYGPTCRRRVWLHRSVDIHPLLVSGCGRKVREKHSRYSSSTHRQSQITGLSSTYDWQSEDGRSSMTLI